MKTALVVNRITTDIELNIRKIKEKLHQCGEEKANLVLFPEAALTGLINNDQPQHDLSYGIEIPGDFTNMLNKFAKRYNFYIGIGLLERENNKLYDTAILVEPENGIILKYRRISPGWHGKKADKKIYREGKELKIVKIPYGTFSFLICGDLFDKTLVKKMKDLRPDWLLYPFARDFADDTSIIEEWEKEKEAYIEQIKKLRTTTLMVNYIAGEELPFDSCFGGAMVVSPEGKIIAEMPAKKEGILYTEIEKE